jgi:hypothetical protein
MSNFMNGQHSLFPELPFGPRWPDPSSLPGQVLERLLTGERLTQVTFGLHRWRLAAYVMTLKYLGWPVESMDVPAPAGCGAGGKIREYWLSPVSIAEAEGARRG